MGKLKADSPHHTQPKAKPKLLKLTPTRIRSQDVSSVDSMYGMFYSAGAFNQNISSWVSLLCAKFKTPHVNLTRIKPGTGKRT